MRTQSIQNWLFSLSDDPAARTKGFDDSAWRAVTVPHDFSVEQPFDESHSSGTGYLPGGIGWYRAHVPASDLRGAFLRLVFHGVYKNADVWVNGYHAGSRPSGYAEFSFDITEFLAYATDDDLQISVRVEHTDLSDSRWYNGSGITRRVDLQAHERVRAERTAVTTVQADADAAVVHIEQTIVDAALESGVDVRVRHEFSSLATGRTHAVEQVIRVDGEVRISAEVRMPQPELWSDTDPRLHRLTTTLSWDGGAAQYAELTGIRSFRFDPDHGFSINDEPRTLKGVCLHEDAGCFGTAVPAEVWLRRLVALKELGCNSIRMSHNPHSPELYDLCDALGFYVIDEAFDEWENPKNKWWQGHNVYPPRHQGYAKDFPVWHERDLVAMIDAHRNHPSIIAWSIGNEVDYPNDPYASPLFEAMTGNNDANKPAAERLYDPTRPDIRRLVSIARSLSRIVREHDPSRPVTFAAAFPELSSFIGLPAVLDLVGYNYKEHLYAEDHRRFPDVPFIGSENGHGYRQWRAVADNDFISGQFLWTGIDYLGEAHGWPIHGSGAGIMTLAGFPKNTWHLRRSWWTDAPVAHLAVRPVGAAEFWENPVSRAVDFAAAGETEILAFANGDAVRLRVDGTAVDAVWNEETGYWSAIVPALAGAVELEALRGGTVVASDRLASAGLPATLVAEVWAAQADAAARAAASGLSTADVIQIECALLGADGAPARGDVLVEVEATGAELLGIENGDLADNTAYSLAQRRTFDGRLVVFVRARGAASVRLRPSGLPEVLVDIR